MTKGQSNLSGATFLVFPSQRKQTLVAARCLLVTQSFFLAVRSTLHLYIRHLLEQTTVVWLIKVKTPSVELQLLIIT